MTSSRPSTRPRRAVAWVAALAAACLIGSAATACGGASDPYAPPAIVYGEDVCDHCGMILSDERFACATIVDAGGRTEPRRFDDIGDMFAYHGGHPELAVAKWYVHDHDSLVWLDAKAAHFVRGTGVRSPMGSGIAAFAEAGRAAAFAAEVGGVVAAFDTLGGGSAAPATPRP